MKSKALAGDNIETKSTHSGNAATFRNYCTCMPYIAKLIAFRSCNIFQGAKRKQCGLCEGCRQKDCGKCKFCLDKPKFGGPGRKKKKCINRHCTGCTTSFTTQLTTVPTNTEGVKVRQPASHTFNEY